MLRISARALIQFSKLGVGAYSRERFRGIYSIILCLGRALIRGWALIRGLRLFETLRYLTKILLLMFFYFMWLTPCIMHLAMSCFFFLRNPWLSLESTGNVKFWYENDAKYLCTSLMIHSARYPKIAGPLVG